MLEQFWRWLRSHFGGNKNPLDNLDTEKLKNKIDVLDRDQEKVLREVGVLQERIYALETDARSENDEIRRRAKATQIVSLRDEIDSKQESLVHISQQRKLLSKLIRYSEQSERMRAYGLDTTFGKKLNIETLRTVIDEATTNASMNVDLVNEATKMLDDAFAYGRINATDDAVQELLDEWERADAQGEVSPVVQSEPRPSLPDNKPKSHDNDIGGQRDSYDLTIDEDSRQQDSSQPERE